ncbi:MAG: ATPase, partial [Burkholderiales bacterium]|nr:ATPase [Burkholderiales bacterium]
MSTVAPSLPRTALRAAFHVGVDGGGSGTRACLQDAAGRALGRGEAGPSGLSQGVEQAWRHVDAALAAAFAAAGIDRPPCGAIAIGLGLAGANVERLRGAFLAADPGYAACRLDNDAIAMLVGAHAGGAGIVVAAGTGSVAVAQDALGGRRLIGGWGFPAGDEGSGAWLGLEAVRLAQAAVDGRAAASALAAAVLDACGG